MIQVNKSDTVKLLEELKLKGFTHDEIAVYLGRRSQTVWAWSSMSKAQAGRVPSKGDYELMKHLASKVKKGGENVSTL
jgi:hypothetical protein